MLILCDFDGTITLNDVTNVLLDEFAGTYWRETLLPLYQTGAISHLDIMQRSYAMLPKNLAELQAIYKDVPLRPNFSEFVSFCQANKHRLIVVSGGLEFYIKDILPTGQKFYSYESEFIGDDKGWAVRQPAWPSLADGEDFKARILQEIKQIDEPTAFIGDGLNDFLVASQSDYVFAVKDSELTDLCQTNHKDYVEFEDFAQIISFLEKEGNNVRVR